MAQNKTKKTNLKKFTAACLPEKKEITITAGEETITFTVDPVITLEKRGTIVREIFNCAFVNEVDSIDGYNPSFIDFAARYAIVTNTTDLKLPDDAEEAWKFLKYTKVYDEVVKAISDDGKYISGQYVGEIIDEAIDMIDSRVAYLENNTDFNKLITKLADSLDKLGDNFKDTDTTQILNIFKNLPQGGSMEDMLKGILKVNKTENSGDAAASPTTK